MLSRTVVRNTLAEALPIAVQLDREFTDAKNQTSPQCTPQMSQDQPSDHHPTNLDPLRQYLAPTESGLKNFRLQRWQSLDSL